MKIVFLCGDAPNQRALACRLHRIVPLSAVAIAGRRAPRKRADWRRRLAAVTWGLPLRRTWFGMLRHYARLFPDFPAVPVTRYDDIDAPALAEMIDRERPDLVLVSGTALLKPPLIERIGRNGRILNLHTGISPYIKGAPNCTNWALALGEFDAIGNTIMWLDAGIDSGAIAATERTPLTGRESLSALHVAVMDHAHDLYGRCLKRLAEGRSLPAVVQGEIDPGRLFLLRHWNGRQMLRAVANFYGRYNPRAIAAPRALRLISPDFEEPIAPRA
ncbi:MAG TPA: formyltransferase family protein [Allosphingosinicella sp.]|nr:formyltransferase family protein [Allosphingosinicella sp.]